MWDQFIENVISTPPFNGTDCNIGMQHKIDAESLGISFTGSNQEEDHSGLQLYI